MKEALLWHREDEKIRCDLCGRRCLIPRGSLGVCLVRRNIEGKLYALNYGKLIAMHKDPIEKKPLFHFYPGSYAFSIASAGCNFACKFCCNYEISQVYREGGREIVGEEHTPADIVEYAESEGCKVISYTYTEPTIFFEFAYDVAKLAHARGLKNSFVTNGYMTPEAIKEISPYLDAATVDFKGSGDPETYRSFCGVTNVEPIYDALIEMKRQGIHIEITNLIIPKHGDDLDHFRGLIKWIKENLGDEIPLHILRFFPTYKFNEVSETPIETLDKAYDVAKEEGMKFVYLGNVPGKREDTHCPNCGELLIRRFGLWAVELRLKTDRCPRCGAKLPIVI